MLRYAVSFLFILFFAASACSSEKSDTVNNKTLSGTLEISQGRARPASQGANSGAYFTIRNGTSQSDTLLEIQVEGFGKAEVHESYTTEEGLSGMRPAGEIPIASGDSLLLQPGGYHVMLMKAGRDFAEGDSIYIELRFARAGSRSMQIPVSRF